ncbi:MAG TPA: alkene reductase [Bryobacteraceae bacterium]|nr:alkene reductase [Bryobacteraceae bacterium]
MSVLFTPTATGSLSLPNRIVMAPMTRSRAGQDAAPNDLHAEYYSQRASAGLILTEGVAPSANGLGYSRTPAIYTPAQIDAWRTVTDAVHAKGGHIAIQIMHVGRIAAAVNQPPGSRVLAPSAVTAPGQVWTDAAGMQPYSTPEAMTKEDIAQAIAEYAQSVRNSREAGFDAVELHAANGYLPNQFLSPNTNQRTDEYGGSPENRIRFVLEVIDAMIAAWEPGRIGIRLSPAGTFNGIDDPEASQTYPLLAAELAKRNIAWIHLVKPPSDLFTQWAALRAAFSGTIIDNLGLTAESGAARIDAGEADLVSFGTPYISNPDLAERFRNNWPLAAPDQTTFYTPGAKGYTDYPAYA